MAGHRKRARKHCGRKRSHAQKRPGRRQKVARKSTAPGLTSAERRRKKYAEDPQHREKVLAWNRAYYARHRTEILEHHRKRYADDANYRDKVAATRLKREYGITPEEYAAMFKRQKGRCDLPREIPLPARCRSLCRDAHHPRPALPAVQPRARQFPGAAPRAAPRGKISGAGGQEREEAAASARYPLPR